MSLKVSDTVLELLVQQVSPGPKKPPPSTALQILIMITPLQAREWLKEPQRTTVGVVVVWHLKHTSHTKQSLFSEIYQNVGLSLLKKIFTPKNIF